ncbi:MAG: ABC transporter ATP-binding protein [Paenacidovorax caeni]|jgi:putative spermidine/putrescine transport system ATP-binding protein|uniref:ABC transporter ATP-binding protein n=1 Tax=Comamonadaceae TaxID=80864 RepID=UPI00138A3AD5|nr:MULTISPECIES: ABC transporter ATP-binding protein [unclassified Acidovorax]MBL8365535.1 ABC transporter ATP-binding protein [Comamonas sp.]MCL4769826.1 ABC transporter ATP-binding protein [Burkholderiaceae bacterium]NCU65974.1 ABC transporter ATP-binding protein [Acidovorax sp. 210-6]
MTASEALVTFRGVQKTYDGTSLVVRDLNLDIQRGEFLSLLGPSGSGKTTTLMMLAGFESPTAGEICLNGQPITRTPPHKRNFGMVFQNYALFPHMTVAENIAYPLHVRKLPRAELEAKVKRALEMVQMDTMGMRYPAQMSGGQQQRVALARALVFDPQLVLMDEPLGALDKQLREHMQIELKALHRRLGVTFVYVTHDQAEALTMSDRVAVFNDGRIQQIDRVDRLYETPVNRFVANFVGDNAVLQAKVHATNGDTCDVVLPSGERLQGINVNRAGVGDAVQCSVRPERIELAEAARPNTVSGTVMDIIYFGDHLRLRCKLPSEAEVMVKLALGHSAVPTPGHRVHLHAPPQHMRVYL